MGEESCVGCRRVIPFYKCSRCGGIVPNPRFASGVVCPECGGQVYEDPHKQTRRYHRYYLCQGCGGVVPNPKYAGDHSCVGCRPATCDECGAFTAWNVAKGIEKCIECGAEYPRST